MLILFKRLHASEINFSITTFWDSKLTFKLGDEVNGFSDTFETNDFEKGLNWLENQAKIVYPDSKFSKEESNNCLPDGLKSIQDKINYVKSCYKIAGENGNLFDWLISEIQK